MVVDTEPGKGAEFRLFFPIVAGVPDGIAPREPPGRPQRGRETLLLVEDEEPLRSVVAKSLRARTAKRRWRSPSRSLSRSTFC